MGCSPLYCLHSKYDRQGGNAIGVGGRSTKSHEVCDDIMICSAYHPMVVPLKLGKTIFMSVNALVDQLIELNYVAVERECLGAAQFIKYWLQKIKPDSIKYAYLKPKTSGTENSLSGLYGLDEFPLHTDGANEVAPPDYIILMAPSTRRTTTLLADPRNVIDVDEGFAKEAVFNVKRLGRNFSAFFVQTRNGTRAIRYNSDSMTPRNSAAFEVDRKMRTLRDYAIAFNWEKTKFLAFDNRVLLHGRGKVIHPLSHLRRIEVYLK
jgi:hypothetical protein